ncbi:MAG: VWA domain-containing protein, partial [Planctomycetota bacterium]|nr:VWA domain-containing protein [Planctomycetota bacterium]
RHPAGDLGAGRAAEVRARPRVPVRRRFAAPDVFHGRYIAESLRALAGAARGEDPDLRLTAMRSLTGWPESRVHLFFLEQLEREAVPLAVALDHFERVRPSLGAQALDMLRSYVGRLYVSSDWRDAARARALLPILDAQRAAPILIESLAVWTRRLEAGGGSKRIQHEIVLELRRISGRSIGAHTERWTMWWKAVREGRVETVEDTLDAGGSVTQSTFFGLNPVTDRVIFVIDRSGSMKSAFGTGGRSRYQEAVEQMLTFVERLGQETRFSVTLFSHDGVRWKPGLVRANDSNLNGARRWLESKQPDGGTMLRAGIDTALDLDRTGRIDLERIEADTVIVLCDGATSEGRAWVEPWLERANDAAQLVFHCVQIGRFGDGTLEDLAAGTGGDFVTIDR